MSDIIAETFRQLRDSINCQLPCKITAINEDGTVDVLVFRNDGVKNCVFPNVPIYHIETGRAYVFLGVQVGDRGVIRYFDRSVEAYKDGNEEDTSDIRQHSLSDGLFQIGFLPSTEKYAYPTGKTIEIGNKNGSFKLSVDPDGKIEIEAQGAIKIKSDANVSIECQQAEVNASSSATIQSPSIDLGGAGGQGVARIGDSVNPQTMKIESGSSQVRAL